MDLDLSVLGDADQNVVHFVRCLGHSDLLQQGLHDGLAGLAQLGFLAALADMLEQIGLLLYAELTVDDRVVDLRCEDPLILRALSSELKAMMYLVLGRRAISRYFSIGVGPLTATPPMTSSESSCSPSPARMTHCSCMSPAITSLRDWFGGQRMSDESIAKWAVQPWAGGTAQGSASAHLDWAHLVAHFEALGPAPRHRGRVCSVVCREPGERRVTPSSVRLCPDGGVVGDRWAQGSADPQMQVAIMRVDVAHLIAAGQHPAIFGDNLLVDLDLSTDHLAPGVRLRVGTAVCVVSEEPHNGCHQFARRFGSAALKLTADKRWRDQHLRGIYLTILQAGDVAPGDVIEVLQPA